MKKGSIALGIRVQESLKRVENKTKNGQNKTFHVTLGSQIPFSETIIQGIVNILHYFTSFSGNAKQRFEPDHNISY